MKKSINNYKQPNQYELKIAEIKILTSLLFNSNLDDSQITNSKLFNSTHRYRLFSYIKSNPKLCWYVNKYLNHKFIFSEKISSKEWIKTFQYLVNSYNMSKYTINYSRYNKNEFIEFSKTINKYYNVVGDITKSFGDISSLYLLYLKGIINDDNINEIKKYIDNINGKGYTKNKHIVSIKPKSNLITKPIGNSQLDKIYNNINHTKTNRPLCKSCKLNKNDCIPFESNIKCNQSVDLMIIGPFPFGSDNLEKKELFSSDNMLYLKDEFIKIINKYSLSYIITNNILCYNHLTNIKNNELKLISDNCADMSLNINNTFNSTIKIIIGKQANSLFNIKLSKNNIGKLFNNAISCDAPKTKLSKIYKQTISNIVSNIDLYFKNNRKYSILDDESENSTINIDNMKIVTRITPNLTLFDIQRIRNQIIYIFINDIGEKRYLLKDINFPVHIKNGIYKDCDYIENQFDHVVYLNDFQKRNLTGILRRKMEKWKYPL